MGGGVWLTPVRGLGVLRYLPGQSVRKMQYIKRLISSCIADSALLAADVLIDWFRHRD